MTALVVALSIAVVLLAVLVAGLLRSHAEILKALHELGAGLELDRGGSPGPVPVTIDGVPSSTRGDGTAEAVTGTTLDDEVVALPLRGAGDTLVAFLSSGCSTCQTFWQSFRDGVRDVPGGARLVVVTRGPDEEDVAGLAERAPRDVPVVLSSETWDAFGVPGSPYFLYVDGETGWVTGEGSGASWPQVADLLSQARGKKARERRDDAALLAAGIGPGHPSLEQRA